MITLVKLDPQGNEKIRYQGELVQRLSQGIIIKAIWTWPALDLGYTRFEPQDCFTEYFYADRWFNIFEIASSDGKRKGWYCNVAEPATIFDDRIEQVDLFLDVWVNTAGKPLVLDEDEFAAATTLSERQRAGAQQGLQTLLHLIQTRQHVFANLATN